MPCPNRQTISTAAERAWLPMLDALEARVLFADFTLQVLHASDLEAGVPALDDAPRFSAVINGLRDDYANTVLLSSGDNWIPSPFYTAGADPSLRPLLGAEGKGRADVAIMNAIGFQAAAFGNHEFDEGTGQVRSIIAPAGAWEGARFPYLSANLNFAPNADLASLVTPDGQESSAVRGKIAKSTVITVNGERVGVVGATTPLLPFISSPGTVVTTPSTTIDPLTPALLTQLAAQIQPAVDALAAAGVNKVIVMTHLQNLTNEINLAPYLRGVDVLMGGGSHRNLTDATDRTRPGSPSEGPYPTSATGADGKPTLIVNTEGNYQYVGRLVIAFNDAGDVLPGSYDPAVSGAFAADDQGVIDAGGAAPSQRVVDIVNALRGVVQAKDGRTFGKTAVYLEGARNFVRNEETNFGNLTADANLAYARTFDPAATLSLKNGGGIRDSIGEIDPPTGNKVAPQGNAFKGPGQVSQLDIENSLRFNNGLSLVTVTAAQLKQLVEHSVATLGGQGRFPQVGGFAFSYDASRPAGSRVVSLVVKDDAGRVTDTVVSGGSVAGDPSRPFRMVTLDFLAGDNNAAAGGDSYPFPEFFRADPARYARVDLVPPGTTAKTIDTTGSEQLALAGHLAARFASTPFAQIDTGPTADQRIQNVAAAPDTLVPPAPTNAISLTKVGTYDSGLGLGAAEISAYDRSSKRLFTINAAANSVDIIDVRKPAQPKLLKRVDVSRLGSPNSVAVSRGLVAVAVQAPVKTDPGQVAFYTTGGTFISSVQVGSLPDMLTFTPDGFHLLVANEAEPSSYGQPDSVDPEGTVTVISLPWVTAVLPAKLRQRLVRTASFTPFNGQKAALVAEGVRIFGPGATVAQDLEPEYIAVSADSKTAYVTLQENNALAVIDIATATVKEIVPLGYKDHNVRGSGIDASDRDGAINIAARPVLGMYQPDAIAAFKADGQTFLITANEGDARDYAGFAEEARVGSSAVRLDPAAFPDAAALKQNANLGRLNVTTATGDADGDGDFDALYAFGGRSFSIRAADGSLVFDSGDALERITAAANPAFFNSNHEANAFDDRSDNKGPEPEAVTTGVVNGRTYAFIGLERVGGVVVYDVTNPAAPAFVQYVNTRDFTAPVGTPAAGDLGPEGLVFVPAADSPSGRPLVIVSNEISGTVAIFEVSAPAAPRPPGRPGRPAIAAGPSPFSVTAIRSGDADDLLSDLDHADDDEDGRSR